MNKYLRLAVGDFEVEFSVVIVTMRKEKIIHAACTISCGFYSNGRDKIDPHEKADNNDYE
jgi:hypothetical protein